ncbi:hypothetical protein [Brevibacillus dissolubilis]|uniref:hypothetical protein n=1 Tax=Brevibacillus dissolubilis TaxID=1844116 RepID=UPI001116DE80|nr:hypothetical protein [Brevibacillus dissolubilis]
MNDNDQLRIVLHPLTFMPDPEGVMIGRFGTDTFAVFPEDGAALVQKLQEGVTIGEAHAWYEETYQEELDMDDFLLTLRELTFIVEDDGAPIETENKEISWQWLGRLAFSPVGWLLYGAIFACAAWIMIKYPELRPSRQSILFSPYTMVVFVGMILGQLPGLLFHEAMHMLAGRRLGIRSRLGLGRRMYFLVFTSSMPGIWGVPREKRFLPILVGMMGDLLWFSLLVIAAGAILMSTGEITLLAGYCMGLAFTTLLRLFWQFYFQLQTDIYYLMITVWGCVNLQETTRDMIKNSWYQATKQTHKLIDLSIYTERDQQVARTYRYFYAAGWLLMVGIFFYMFPVVFQLLSNVFNSLITGTDMRFWDSIVFLSFMVIHYSIILYLYWKERQARKKVSHAPMSQEG